MYSELNSLKLNNTIGCCLCNSTWGNFYADIDGEHLFFCCKICAKAFQNMIEKIKKLTHWRIIDSIVITGGTRGRSCLVSSRSEKLSFNVAFDSNGNISYLSILQ